MGGHFELSRSERRRRRQGLGRCPAAPARALSAARLRLAGIRCAGTRCNTGAFWGSVALAPGVVSLSRIGGPLLSGKRLAVEERLLAKYFRGIHIQDAPDGPNPGVIGTLTTNGGSVYAVWLPLVDFPDGRPQIYVVHPKLKTYEGGLLAEEGKTSKMHTLDPNEHGHVQICHYRDAHWHSNITLYKVVMKARLWLEAYDRYLETGRTLDQFLDHM